MRFTNNTRIIITGNYFISNNCPIFSFKSCKSYIATVFYIISTYARTIFRIPVFYSTWINLKRLITNNTVKKNSFFMFTKKLFSTKIRTEFLTIVFPVKSFSPKFFSTVFTFLYGKLVCSFCFTFFRTIFSFIFSFKMFSANITSKFSHYSLPYVSLVFMWGWVTRESPFRYSS